MKVTGFCSSRTKLCLAITATLAALGPALATAQQSTAGGVEEIQVTGTRVRLADGMSAPTPVTSLTTDELRNFDPGTTMAAQLAAEKRGLPRTTTRPIARGAPSWTNNFLCPYL